MANSLALRLLHLVKGTTISLDSMQSDHLNETSSTTIIIVIIVKTVIIDCMMHPLMILKWYYCHHSLRLSISIADSLTIIVDNSNFDY